MSLRHRVQCWLGTRQLADAYFRNADNAEGLRKATIGLGNGMYKVAEQVETIMSNLEAYNSAIAKLSERVAALTTVEQSAVALIQGLRSRISQLVAENDGLVPVEELQKLSDSIDMGTKTLSDAVAANTAPAPDPSAPQAPDTPPSPETQQPKPAEPLQSADPVQSADPATGA